MSETPRSGIRERGEARTLQLEPLLLDVGGVAKVLGISRRSVFSLLSSGRLIRADVQLGIGRRSRKWRRSTVEAWVRAGCPLAETWEARQAAAGGREREAIGAGG
jgi:predicted DNA-binding transcriptional regulator AlpA